ncbi:GNAT family N-acetyltransferase [Dactylosporangium sp. NPDC005572]|uniref:GNAT family N-acetyltransferase n=1 Tax=Dactylosporangium sp. NPDC005572 TaxID=3156889 RepID=UPI0033B6E7F6
MDQDLYRRSRATLLASWEEYARASAGAAVHHLPGVSAAVFPAEPERAVYNNAVLEPGAAAVAAMEAVYRAAGIGDFAAWVHESDGPGRSRLERRGYAVAEHTRAMARELVPLPPPGPVPEPAGWAEYLAFAGLPAGLLATADHAALHPLVLREDGVIVAAALAYDHAGDCGIYNVATAPHARRRGLATALTLAQLHAAAGRGCTTASLQSSPMAERVYAGVGFRDLGRILEYRRVDH